MVLRKYKVFILILSTGIFLTTMVGGYYLMERDSIRAHYSSISKGLIGMANEHLKSDQLEWNFDRPLSEKYVQELTNIYSFAKKNYYLDEIILIDKKGSVVYSNHSSLNNDPSLAKEKLSELDQEENTVIFPRLRWFGEPSNFDIETYQPVKVNGELAGYILLKFNATAQTYLYLNYNQWFIPVMSILLLVLSIFLGIYLLRYLRAEEKLQHTQQMLEQLFDNASDGILLLDENKTITMMNKAMAKMIGRDLNEETLTCKALLSCKQDGREIKEDHCPLSPMNLRKSSLNPFDFEILNNKKETLNVSASISTLKNDVTGETQTIMLIRDETKKKKEALQLEVLEEFEKMLNSPVGMENMVDFIVEKMKTLMNCDRVLIFEGLSYESSILLNKSELKNISQEVQVSAEADIVAQTYITQKIQEVSHNPYFSNLQKKYNGKSFLSVPLVVNQQIIGVLVLVYENENPLETKNNMLLKKISTNMAALIKVYKLILETNEQRKLSERMYKLGITFQTMNNEQEVRPDVLDEVKNMAGFDFIAYRNEHNHYTVWNTAIGNLHPTDTYDSDKDILEFVLKWGQAVFIENYPERKGLEFNNYALIEKEQLKTIYATPLIYNNKILGAVMLGSRELKVITEERKQLIRTLVNMLAVQIENKNLYSQIENDATILERQRISREIHDGLAQNIGFITIQLHRLKKLMEKNQIAKAIQEIEIVKEAVDESYIELRETIDQLRDLSGYKENLSSWLKKYFQEFEQTHKIKINFELNNRERVQLNENQRVQITRVIQEVLNNIRKHSEATEVKVYLSGDKNLLLIIEDNGVGFDMMTLKKSKYSGHGLPILEERIQSINGNIHIDSKPNQGTKVEIHVPMVG